MTLQTRRPTGKPPWPILLLAGAEKAGKSWAAALASASDLVGRTLWISVGEDDPDEYGAIPGADFEIVLHDGTYRDILRAVTEASEAPRVDAKPTLLVVDSQGMIWDLLTEMAQIDADRRATRKAGGRKVEEAKIANDLWNIAAKRWRNILDALRRHDGPVIVTARLELQTVFENGEPTKEKALKVKAQKNLPFDVGAIVQLPARGEAWLTGVRSVRWQSKEERVKLPDFTVDALWRQMGLAEEDATAPRQHTSTDDRAGQDEDTADDAREALLDACRVHDVDPGSIAARYTARHGYSIQTEEDPEPIRAFIAELSPAE